MKQVLLVNDVVGHSHVGMVAMLPILTYMGQAVYNLPTALVSNTLDYGHFNVMETTDYMRATLPVWKQLGFRFDAVCTGLMFSEEQAHTVEDYCRYLKREGTQVFVDPVMGDNGRLYNGIGTRQVELMRKMLSVADLTLPNYTEACYLADVEFRSEGISWDEAQRLLDAVAALGAGAVVITSANVEGGHSVVGCNGRREKGLAERYFRIDYEELPKTFHGTGDIFSALLVGCLLRGWDLEHSTRTAMQVVSRLIERNMEQEDTCLGIPIEKCLDLLQELAV